MSIGPKSSSKNPYVRDPSFPGKPIQSVGKDILVSDGTQAQMPSHTHTIDNTAIWRVNADNMDWESFRKFTLGEDLLKANPIPKRYKDVVKEIEKDKKRLEERQALLEKVKEDLESFALSAGDFAISRQHGKCVILNPVSVSIEAYLHPPYSSSSSKVFPDGFDKGYEILVIKGDGHFGTTAAEHTVSSEDVVPYSKEALILYEKKT